MLVQSSTIEPKHLAFFMAETYLKPIVRFKTSGSIYKIEPAVGGFKMVPAETFYKDAFST